MKTIAAVALALFLVGSSGHAQKSHPASLPRFVYGTWVVYKFVEVGGHAGETRERAEAQVGKMLKISTQSFNHDNNLFWLGSTACKSVKYKLVSEDDGGKGSLGFYGLADSERTEFISVICDKQAVCSLELAKNQELAVYLDGWFFFLRKTETKPTE